MNSEPHLSPPFGWVGAGSLGLPTQSPAEEHRDASVAGDQGRLPAVALLGDREVLLEHDRVLPQQELLVASAEGEKVLDPNARSVLLGLVGVVAVGLVEVLLVQPVGRLPRVSGVAAATEHVDDLVDEQRLQPRETTALGGRNLRFVQPCLALDARVY